MPHSLYISGTPDEVKNSKGLHLVTHNTQNGQKVQILLEELKDKYGLQDELQLSQANQWLFFWHGSGAPYQGNKGFFSRAAEKLPFAIVRFHNETLRVYGVLEIQLSGKFTGLERDYLAGDGKGKYSVADIGTWSWVNRWRLSGFSEEELGQFPHLLKWIDRVAAREAVQRGIGAAYQLKE
ncbi:hypothetical protein V490_07229 [Pseudogymnoascus sp. VKM F-3557]|nr:hypothetical protein V490_07229 [Pseudogymnoascus sp. VKM F-3557]